MRFDEVATTATSVLARGGDASVWIESPLEGVYRIRVSWSGLPPKESFACVPLVPRAIEVTRRGDILEIDALRFDLATGTWSFAGAQGGGYLGDVRPGFPIAQAKVGMTLEARAGEAYVGFGEKVGPVDKRGLRFAFWNTDAYPPEPHTDPLYVSIPFFVALGAGDAWGFFLDETARSAVDVARKDADRIAWSVEGAELDAYVIAGPLPADVLRRYHALTGAPFVPPLWSLGAQQSRWGYDSADEVREVVRGYRERGLPLDVMMVDIDHMDAFKVFTWHPERYAAPAALVRDLRADGVRVVPIVDPGIKVEPGYAVYEEARAGHHLVELERGDPLVGEVWPDPAVFPDLTRPAVQAFWAEQHRPLLDAGVAGIWNDMNEPACFSIAESRGVPAPHGVRLPGASKPLGSTLPDEARHGKRRHLEVHNAYANGMAKAAAMALAADGRRPWVLTRAAYAGIQRHAAIWTGDFRSHFTHLEATVPMLLGLGVSGVPFVGADVGGFVGDSSGELLVRWSQALALAPLFRNHTARDTAFQEPWRFGEPYLAHVRAALELRYRWLPALYTALVGGALPLAPLAFAWPDDREAIATTDQMLFADAVMIAPVVRSGQARRLVYLPGRWADLRTGQEASGHVVTEAPLDVLPLFLREGRGVATTDHPALHTTTASWSSVTWLVFPGPDGALTARLYEDAGDGPVDGTWTELRGTAGGVHRSTPSPRPETVVVYPGGQRHALDAGWTELRVR